MITIVESTRRPLKSFRRPKKASLRHGRGKSVKVALKRPKKRPKTKSLSKLKRDLDNLFSKYIRAKYAKECYTCGFKGNLQCGHFVSRSYLATRWDETNCRPQCAMCNIWGRGKLLDFEERLVKELGADHVAFLKEKRKELTKLKPEWYEAQILTYQQKLLSV